MHATSVSKGVLKAKMLSYFREIERTQEPLIVMDRHRPVLKIIPYQGKRLPHEVFGEFQGKVRYTEDINMPTIDEWSDA